MNISFRTVCGDTFPESGPGVDDTAMEVMRAREVGSGTDCPRKRWKKLSSMLARCVVESTEKLVSGRSAYG